MELVENDAVSGTSSSSNLLKTLVVEGNLLPIMSPRTAVLNEIAVCDDNDEDVNKDDDELQAPPKGTSHKLTKSYSEQLNIAEESAPLQAAVSSTDKRRFGYLRPTISSQVKKGRRVERRGRILHEREPSKHEQTSSRATAL